jgi:hypothetical protein
MHIDESKKFDKRNIERNIKNGVITKKDYEIYLSKLIDVSDKIFIPEEEALTNFGEFDTELENEIQSKKKGTKRKFKVKPR